MSLVTLIKSRFARKLENWLTRIGENNRPIPHDYDHLAEESRLLNDSDRFGDEKGEFGNRY